MHSIIQLIIMLKDKVIISFLKGIKMKRNISKIRILVLSLLVVVALIPLSAKIDADDGWVEITNLATTANLVDFVIDPSLINAQPGTTYTGHLRIGKPATSQDSQSLNAASYYITRKTGTTSEDITASISNRSLIGRFSMAL